MFWVRESNVRLSTCIVRVSGITGGSAREIGNLRVER